MPPCADAMTPPRGVGTALASPPAARPRKSRPLRCLGTRAVRGVGTPQAYGSPAPPRVGMLCTCLRARTLHTGGSALRRMAQRRRMSSGSSEILAQWQSRESARNRAVSLWAHRRPARRRGQRRCCALAQACSLRWPPTVRRRRRTSPSRPSYFREISLQCQSLHSEDFSEHGPDPTRHTRPLTHLSLHTCGRKRSAVVIAK